MRLLKVTLPPNNEKYQSSGFYKRLGLNVGFVVLLPESPGTPQKALRDGDSVLCGQEGKGPGRQEEAAAQELPRAPDQSELGCRPGDSGVLPAAAGPSPDRPSLSPFQA